MSGVLVPVHRTLTASYMRKHKANEENVFAFASKDHSEHPAYADATVHQKAEAEETEAWREEQVQQPDPKKQGKHQKSRCIYYH